MPSTPALRADLRRAVREVNDDPAVLAVILTGAGRAFCAGADLAETAENPEHFRVEDQLNGEYKPILLEMNRAGKPWIAAVNGAAAGIGSAFALNCDLVVMAENAYIYQAFAAIGLVPDGGATWHLVRTLGRHRAYEVIVSGEKIRAAEMPRLGPVQPGRSRRGTAVSGPGLGPGARREVAAGPALRQAGAQCRD